VRDRPGHRAGPRSGRGRHARHGCPAHVFPRLRGAGHPTVLSVRRFVLLTAVLPLCLVTPPVGAAEDGTPCTFEVDVTLSPGLSRQPSSGTFDSKGETGRLDCQGSVGGKPVTGRGTFGAEGRYGIDGNGDDCRSKEGRGDGTGHFTVPVEGGSEHVDDPFKLTYRVDGRSVV